MGVVPQQGGEVFDFVEWTHKTLPIFNFDVAP